MHRIAAADAKTVRVRIKNKKNDEENLNCLHHFKNNVLTPQ